MLSFLRRKPKDPETDPTSIINLLVRLGWVSKDGAMRALAEKHDRLIGQVLIERGMLTVEQLEEALFQQRVARGQVTAREITSHAMQRQAHMQDKMIAAVNDLKTTAATVTGRVAPAGRKA